MIGQSHNAVFVCAPPVVTYRMSLAAERLHHVRTYGQLEGEITPCDHLFTCPRSV